MNRRSGITAQTGPGLLTRVIEQSGWEDRAGLRIFPSAFFYPYDVGEPWLRDEEFVTAYAVHHWNDESKGHEGVGVSPSDLLPRGAHDARATAKALTWQVSRGLRHRVEWPAKRRVARLLRKAIAQASTSPSSVSGMPWGDGQVLVSAPLGTRLLCPTEDVSLSPELALYGTYDPGFVDFLARSLWPGMTFVDVGANFGLFTLIGGVKVGRGGRVFAYECNPEVLSFLDRNVEMNWLADRVRIVPKAAHRDDEIRELVVPRDFKGLGSFTRFQEGREDARDEQRFRVACERLDHGLRDVPYVDLMKIDVEVGEAAAIDGAWGLIADQRIGIISLEYRLDVLPAELRDEMERMLTRLTRDHGATFSVPGDPRSIPLDEVHAVAMYPQLLVKFPNATISNP